MNGKVLNALLISFVLSLGWSVVWAAQAQSPYPANATFTTLIPTPLAIEGLTGDGAGNLYTTGRGGNPCPVWRINLTNPSLIVVGNVTAPCAPSGIAFNKQGDLFLSDGDKILTFTPNDTAPPTAVVYATGVPGTNGLAFDKLGNLWTGDGTTGLGRVWKIRPGGGDCTPNVESNCEEIFRIQPMRNSTALGGAVANPSSGVGRQATTFPGTAQDLVANGVAFDASGNLFVADTARGALWQVKFNANGTLKSHLGCDETFHPNTLCLNHIFGADPRFEGADGIALDQNGNIWISANERNAIAIFGTGVSAEVFRNPVNASNLRNSAADNTRILEFPTSPFLSGTKFCTANSDGNRRDNSPASDGEISPSGPWRGKISCMDQALTSPGFPLPVQ